MPAAQLSQQLGFMWFHPVGDVSTQLKLHHALLQAALLLVSSSTCCQARFSLVFCSHLPMLHFKADACGQRSLEKDEPRAAGSLQKSEVKVKEKVSYSPYLVKP